MSNETVGRLALTPSSLPPLNLEETPELWKTWLFGLLIITAASFLSPAAILMVPLLHETLYERIMVFLVALGIGAMSGSCIFILIPQAFDITDVAKIDYVTKSWLMISALYAFFVVDRLLQCIVEYRRRRRNHRKVHVSTLNAILKRCRPDKKKATTKVGTPENGSIVPRRKNNDGTASYHRHSLIIDEHGNVSEPTAVGNGHRRYLSHIQSQSHANHHYQSNSNHRHYDGHGMPATLRHHQRAKSANDAVLVAAAERRLNEECNDLEDDVEVAMVNNVLTRTVHEKIVIEKSSLEVASVAYMIIFGSSANNFVDGMSTGAAFSDSIIRGATIGLAVLSQQFPQELGTLAILARSGLGIRRALLFNLLPITLSYVGFAFGVFLDNVDDSYDSFIFAVSAGMYFYIFLGTLIPEIRQSFQEHLRRSWREAALTTALQFSGIAFGVGFLYLMN